MHKDNQRLMTEVSKTYNVPRGTAYLTSQQVIIYITYFLFYVIIARILSKVEIGQVGLLAGAQAVFSAVTQLALQPTATRYIASSIGIGKPTIAGSVAKSILRLTLFTAGIGIVASILLSPLLAGVLFKATEVGSEEALFYLIITFVSGFVLDLATLYGAFFLGAGMYAEAVYQNVLYVPLSRGLGLVLALAGLSVLGITLGWAIGAVVMLLLSIYLWKGKIPAAGLHPLKPLIAFTLPLFVSSLIITMQQWGDIAILQALLGQTGTTGGYYLIVQSVGFLSVLWMPVSSALYPTLSAHSLGGRQALSEKVNLALRLINLAVLPLGVSLAALSQTVLEIVYPGYASDAVPFAILTLATVLAAEAAILTVSLQAVGKTLSLLKVTMAATTVDLVSVALTARILGPTAGALGRVLLALTTVILASWALRSTVNASPRNGLSKAGSLALAMGLSLLIIDQLLVLFPISFSLPISILSLRFLIHFTTTSAISRLPILSALFLGSFIGFSRSMRTFRPEDFTILRNMMPKPLHGLLKNFERMILYKD